MKACIIFWTSGVDLPSRLEDWSEARRAEDPSPKGQERGGVLGKGAASPLPIAPPMDLGERCKLSDGVRGKASAAIRFLSRLSTQNSLSWHFRDVNDFKGTFITLNLSDYN